MRRGTVVRALLSAILLAAIFWYFGADVWYALLFASALTTVALVLSARSTLADRGQTAWRGEGVHVQSGARNNVAELSWSLESRFGRVSHAALVSVSDVARRRLAARHLDLREPNDRAQIEQLIGRRAYLLLVSRPRRRPYLRSLVHCLDALDALETSRQSASTPVASKSRRAGSTLSRTA